MRNVKRGEGEILLREREGLVANAKQRGLYPSRTRPVYHGREALDMREEKLTHRERDTWITNAEDEGMCLRERDELLTNVKANRAKASRTRQASREHEEDLSSVLKT